jgi:CubicO group peptidase (beta-lactamase class C family)
MLRTATVDERSIQTAVEEVLALGHVPGAALAIVHDNHLIYERGFGHRDHSRSVPVTPETLYPVASTTKAMTATLVAMLSQSGLLDWDGPITNYGGKLAVGATARGDSVTLRDLVTMNTGLPRHDAGWLFDATSRTDVIEHVANLALSAERRRKFQYTNWTPTMAGLVCELVTGKSWETLVAESIFRPLGMEATTCSLPREGNVIAAWREDANGELVAAEMRTSDVIAPAGGTICSTVQDMARWMQFNLAEEIRADLLSSDLFDDITTPHIPVRGTLTGTSPTASYGLGWVIDCHRGFRRIFHAGYLSNINSDVSLFPDVGIGIVNFTNFGAPALSSSLSLTIFDILMKLSPSMHSAERWVAYERQVAERLAANACAPRICGTSPSRPLQAFAGHYSHPGYGQIEVKIRNGHLALSYGFLDVALVHHHYDCWVGERNRDLAIHLENPFEPTNPLMFEGNEQGEIDGLRIRFEPAVGYSRFQRGGGSTRKSGDHRADV